MQHATSILWLASWYPTKLDPFPGDFIQRHAKALSKFYPVHVLHIAKDEQAAITRSSKTEQFTHGMLTETILYYHPRKTGIRPIDRLISTQSFLKAGRKWIAAFLEQHPTTLIHVHVAMRHGLLALWAKKKFGTAYVITEHWTGYNQKEYPAHLRPAKWFWIATKNIFQQASFFYPEVNIVGRIVNETITSIPFQPVSNAVDTSLFYYQPKTDPQAMFRFIHVSTLSYQKNIKGILDVIEKLGAYSDRYLFTLVGPVEPSIGERVRQSEVLQKMVHLTGAVSYETVAAEVRQSHALLMFSRFENQPCVILEALCAGLPVISTRVGGIAEVLDESNGILIDSGDEAALERSIHQMFGQYAQFQSTAIASLAQSKYSYEKIGEQMLDYYRINPPGLSG